MTTLAEDARALREKREAADDAVAESKALKAEYKEMEYEFIERMKQEEVESVKTDGVMYSPKGTIYGAINDRSEFIKWAEENDEELIEKKERKQLLNQLARRHVDDGDPLPPGVTFSVTEYVGQTAS